MDNEQEKQSRKEYQQAWYQANKDRNAASAARYRAKHRGELAAKQAEIRAKRPIDEQAELRAYKRGYNRGYQAGQRELRQRDNTVSTMKARARRSGVAMDVILPELLAQKLAYYGGKCWICRDRVHQHWDHVKPIAKGGAHILANLRPACARCNMRKSDTWPF